VNITRLTVQTFGYQSQVVRDDHGHGHPGKAHDASQSLLTIATDSGAEGHALGPSAPVSVKSIVEPLLVGEDPFIASASGNT
jgi:hypothetical protein